MWTVSKTDKYIGSLLIIIGILFFITEYITLSHANIPTITAYIGYSISELAVPLGDPISAIGPPLINIYNSTVSYISPIANLINIEFIALAIINLIACFVVIKKYISKYKEIFYLTSLILTIGLIIVAVFHTGGPNSEDMHKLGALMLFFGGSFLLIFTGLLVEDNPIYKKSSLILGVLGILCGIGFCIVIKNPTLTFYRGVIERGNIYPTVIWFILSGIMICKSKLKTSDSQIQS